MLCRNMPKNEDGNVPENIFGSFKYGHYSEWFDTNSRLDRVKEFNLDQLNAALTVQNLQKSVKTAIERSAALQICRNTLLAMIADGRIKAVNLKRPGGKYDVWRVDS
jgi:hypothetical protein